MVVTQELEAAGGAPVTAADQFAPGGAHDRP